MKRDAINEGVDIHCGVSFIRCLDDGAILSSTGEMRAGYVVNAAGLYADQVASQFGFSEHYRILPFKGLYLYSDEPAGAIRTNIYPVPDLRNPFLGVHFTVAANGAIKTGPTAIPAFWRENYQGWGNFDLGEALDVLSRQAGLFFHSDFDFRRLALEEIRKCSRRQMVRLAQALAFGVEEKNYRCWGKPGIRAQLLDIRKQKLEMDFVIEGNAHSMHILNAVSPAFTCSMPLRVIYASRFRRRLAGEKCGTPLHKDVRMSSLLRRILGVARRGTTCLCHACTVIERVYDN